MNWKFFRRSWIGVAHATALAAVSLFTGFAEEEKAVVSTGNDPASKLVNGWFREGKAAGLDGVWYDNRDRKHSDLRIATYPQMQAVTYTPEELKVRADWGGQRKLLPGKVVVGNSSTASPANQAGSHQRMYYLHPKGLVFLYQQYRTNALYVYPEHRDHDPGTNGPDGYGDLYPANSPYLISSQGSSGSDKVFMHAVLKTIAAFPPETQEKLIAKGLLMPTVQAIFRKAYKASDGEGDYFAGKAQPSVFDGKLIDEVAMVTLAQAMAPDAIPPLVHLRVLEETEVEAGVDFFEPAVVNGERISDSACAIARVFRGGGIRRTVRITAKDSVDLGGRKLKFRWAILRGDPERITIESKGESGEEAVISIAHHPRRPIAPGSALWSNRVDIGVFAEAEGSLVSAPAFVSFTSLASEHRTYTGDGKLLEIFYGARSPSLGMPNANEVRWDLFLDGFAVPESERSPMIKLLSAVLEKDGVAAVSEIAAATRETREKFRAVDEKLKAITKRQQEKVDEANKVRVAAVAAHKKKPTDETKAALDAANAKHNAEKKALRDGVGGAAELKKELAGLRSGIDAAIRDGDAQRIVRDALGLIRADPEYFSKNEEVIRSTVKDSADPKRAGALAAALKRLEFVGVEESEDPPPNERYHLEQRNLDLLSEVMFPQFLSRPSGPLYNDPRLSVPKDWRDVYRYNDAGELTGWSRFRNGGKTEYTAAGQLIKTRKKEDGSPDETVEVVYVYDPKAKRLNPVEKESSQKTKNAVDAKPAASN